MSPLLHHVFMIPHATGSRRSLSPPPRSAHYDAYPGGNGYSGDRSGPPRDDKRVRDYPTRRDPEIAYRRA